MDIPYSCLPQRETYHICLSSTINIIIPELFEFSEKITDKNGTVVTCRIIGMFNLMKKPLLPFVDTFYYPLLS
jgi:hypothetical protein